MRSVDIKYHVVTTATADLPFPSDDLKLLFRTTGIDLNLIEGERIAVDPTFDAFLKYSNLVQLYGKKDRNYGHLIIGLYGPEFGHRSDVAGELLDQEGRGVAVVYTRADYIQREGKDAFLQTCAHEIGHMLNLGHGDVAFGFVSAMNQAQDRELDTPQSWQEVEAEARQERNRGKPDYFYPPVRQLKCYPFALNARCRLNNISDDQLLPWRGKFERSYDGVNNAWSRNHRSHLEPEQNQSWAGQQGEFHL